MAWVLGLLGAAAACNGILALDELPRGTTTAADDGRLFVYAEDSCGSCMATSPCGEEEQACHDDSGCRALYECLVTCKLDDVGCRYDCGLASPTALTQPLASSLDACRRDHCQDLCFGSGGLVSGLFDDECSDCIDSTCTEQARACIADPRCERAYACMSDAGCKDPECPLRCYYDVGEVADPAAASSLEHCWAKCGDKCPAGTEWSCVQDGFSWGQADSNDVLPYLLTVKAGGFATGVDVETCWVGCEAAGKVDSEGHIELKLEPIKGRWNGYVRLSGSLADSGAEILPARFYFGRPLTRFENRVGVNVAARADYDDVASWYLKTTLDPSLGHLIIAVWDCLFQEAPGIELALDDGVVDESMVVFYTRGEGPPFETGDGQVTDRTATGGFINIEPGLRTVVAKLDGVEVSRIQVEVEADTMTGVYLNPRELQP